jgi:hypothetical protein
MRTKAIIAVLIVALAAGGWWWIGRGRARAAEPSDPAAVRQNVELTVYAQDFALVHETRPAQLTQGDNRLRVPDVSRQLDPQSVLLQWSGNAGSAPEVVAQSYDLGVANGESVLKRYLGREVEVVRYADNGREADRMKGRLMAESGGGILLQADGKFYVNPPGTVVTPANRDIVTIPQLSIQADSPAAQSANLDVAYLTRGLSWSADYVARLSPQGNTLALECNATVTNRTGVDYPNAKVSLIAGSPNRAARQVPAAAGEMETSGFNFADGHGRMLAAKRARSPSFEAPQAVGEFYSYRIKKPTTVIQERMNRLQVLSGDSVPVLKDYSARLPALYAWDDYYGWGTPDRPRRGSVALALTFFNREKDGLGMPLPHGDIRLYEPDSSGALRYAGAAFIPDTPNNQKVNITLAGVFDVFTETRIVRRQRIDRHMIRKQVEVVLHNEKAAPVDLRIVQDFGGRWKITQESHKHANLNAYQSQWTVNIPSGSRTTLSYTVDLGA